MTATSVQDQIDELFADARQIQAQAVERLEQHDIRDAAEKAWCAPPKRATDALILARTGEQPGPTGLTSDGLDDLVAADPTVASLTGPILQPPSVNCTARAFYTGACNRHTERPNQGNRGITSPTPRRLPQNNQRRPLFNHLFPLGLLRSAEAMRASPNARRVDSLDSQTKCNI